MWERIQEQSATVSRTRQQINEVNTRLQSRFTLRNHIRRQAEQQSTALLATQQTLSEWLNAHDRFRLWNNESGGWRALFAQQASDNVQLAKWQQQQVNDSRKLESLPPVTLNLTAEEVAAALVQHAQQRPLRQQLLSLHGQIVPRLTRLSQLQATITHNKQELARLNTLLEAKRQQYKDKYQQYQDVKTLCEQEARIKDLESQRAQLQSGQPCPLCGSTTHPAVAAYQALEPGVNQARRDALEKEVKTLADEGATLRGQSEAVNQQLQRDESEAQTLAKEEQALTQQWQTTIGALNLTLQPQDDIQPR